jgi:hypothetical protein
LEPMQSCIATEREGFSQVHLSGIGESYGVIPAGLKSIQTYVATESEVLSCGHLRGVSDA